MVAFLVHFTAASGMLTFKTSIVLEGDGVANKMALESSNAGQEKTYCMWSERPLIARSQRRRWVRADRRHRRHRRRGGGFASKPRPGPSTARLEELRR